jgi:hypothetical protein
VTAQKGISSLSLIFLTSLRRLSLLLPLLRNERTDLCKELEGLQTGRFA